MTVTAPPTTVGAAAQRPGHAGHGLPSGGASATPSPPASAPAAPVVTLPRHAGSSWSALATVAGRPIAWLAQRDGVTLMRFDQGLLRLHLHAGAAEPAGGGWSYGSEIGGG